MTKKTHIKKVKPLKPALPNPGIKGGPGTGNGEGCIPVR